MYVYEEKFNTSCAPAWSLAWLAASLAHPPRNLPFTHHLTHNYTIHIIPPSYRHYPMLYSSSSCAVPGLAVGTSRAARAAAAATCCTARCYCSILLVALSIGTVYYLLHVCEYGLLLLAIHIPE